jgi:hypothetical protein
MSASVSIVFEPPFSEQKNNIPQIKKSVQSFLIGLQQIPDLVLKTPIKITVSSGDGYLPNLETLETLEEYNPSK